MRRLALLLALTCLPLGSAPRVISGPAAGSSGSSFVDEYRLFRQREPGRPTPARTQAIEHAWTLFEYVPDSFPGVRRNGRTSDLFDEAYYRRAMSAFDEARRIAGEMRAQLGTNERLRRAMKAGAWWRRVDAHARFDRRKVRLRRSYRRRLVDQYRLVIASLDRIRSTRMRTARRVQVLRKVAMRFIAVHQIGLGELVGALGVLQDYERLFPGAAQEWPMHYYLSACYEAAFRQARRDPGLGESHLRRLRRKKNLHLLRAVELKFGLRSYQYEMVWRRVRLDELGSPRSSPVRRF